MITKDSILRRSVGRVSTKLSKLFWASSSLIRKGGGAIVLLGLCITTFKGASTNYSCSLNVTVTIRFDPLPRKTKLIIYKESLGTRLDPNLNVMA